MVYVGDKKYACETCIKGHRSSSCKHTDRPLFEIKKKGRPVTQCEHCRELRKTRQIHVKCACENKDSGEDGVGLSNKEGTKLLSRATFPSGLPEELLEASAASQPFSDGSDSDHSSRSCSCKDSASCTCWTPRTRGKRPAKAPERYSRDGRPAASSAHEIISQPAALVVHAHAGNNRPVLPKPPPERPSSPPRTSHSPSALQSGRLPTHGQSFYSPYSRAYDYVHRSAYPSSNDISPAVQSGLNDSPGSGSPFGDWSLDTENPAFPTSRISPPVCGCGPSCACPGCMEHKGPNVDLSAACANPNTCTACLECNINTLNALATGTSRAVYDSVGMQNIDDWLRGVSSMPNLSSTAMPSQSTIFPPASQSQPELRYDPSIMQAYGVWDDFQNSSAPSLLTQPLTSDCCGGHCKCSVELCRCPPNCCGCRQGCQCTDCARDIGSGRTLSFAVSGERAPCCGGNDSDRRSSSGASTAGPNIRAILGPGVGSLGEFSPYGDGTWLTPTLMVPRTALSRPSSSSSKSSAAPSVSASSSSPSPFGDVDKVARHSAVMPTNMETISSCCSPMAGMSTSPTSLSSASRRRGSDHNEHRTGSVEYHPQSKSQPHPHARPY